MATHVRAGTDRNANHGLDATRADRRCTRPPLARDSLRRGGRQSGPAHAELGLTAQEPRAGVGSSRGPRWGSSAWRREPRALTQNDAGHPVSTTRRARGRGSLLPEKPTMTGAVREKRVVLRDGSRALIRQLQPGDAALVAEAFAGLSAQSRQQRFLTDKPELSPAELRYFAQVDHHDHEALGAVSRRDGRGVGVARYIRDPQKPEAAEIAVAVIDEWHGRGLGTELLTQLAQHARREGIAYFTALVAADNVAVAALLRNIGTELRLTGREGGTVEYEITLTPPGSGRGTEGAATGARVVPGQGAQSTPRRHRCDHVRPIRPRR
jgi:RimJ/RimL family protein N-acetyltransferase